MSFDTNETLALEEARRSPSAEARRERFLGIMAPRPGERVLDLGCGGGTITSAIATRVLPGGHVTGVDISRDAIEIARSSRGQSPGLTFTQADAHDLPFPDGAFDAATCVSVVVFCAEPPRVLAELRRVLRPGGRLLVVNSDETSRTFHCRDETLGRTLDRAIARRVAHADIGGRLPEVLTEAGFSIEHVESNDRVERRFAANSPTRAWVQSIESYLVGSGGVMRAEYDRWLADLFDLDRRGEFCYHATTWTVLARR